MNIYKFYADIVYVVFLLVHIVLVHVAIAVTFNPDSSTLWAIPFAIGYVVFIGLTMGLVYHYILPEKSQIYWCD